MNKIERKNLIMERAIARGMFAAAVFLIPSTRAEVKNEARAVKAKVESAMNDEIRDEEEIGVSPSIPDEAVTVETERESDVLLSRRERQQLALELFESRKERDARNWFAGRSRGMWLVLA